MLNSCLEKYLIVYQFQNILLKKTRLNSILLPCMGLTGNPRYKGTKQKNNLFTKVSKYER